MIAHLRGKATKHEPGVLTVDVHGVGYLLHVPLDTWDAVTEEEDVTLSVYTHVREDRLELFGFSDWSRRMLFAQCVKMSGIGPAVGLELCSVPGALLSQAITEQDASLLTNIKGIGRKKAEKLLLDLQSLVENHPALLQTTDAAAAGAAHDRDAVAALQALGYDNATITQALKNIPDDAQTTEERVGAALRAL